MKLVGDDGVLYQELEGHNLEGVLVGGFEDDRAGCAGLLYLEPAGGTDTPAVARLKSLKAILRHRSGEIVAERLAGGQKTLVYDTADRVDAEIIGAGVAAAVPVEASHWFTATDSERLTKHVARGSLFVR